ncbi:sugar ABC transporter ATP-binding protein [Pelolinea submarina]|uniref:Ribose/galactose/methyl galactoside import ATP-binding protein n=1 Tax=Pelolinea submarina TaxID=913107 RepID=A0A347ZPK5_9CHLR|nr:sugar ABC transporter ATP-binding protein [Pelolinea submarina]REG04749.1 monosaccharide ABC transporter ATP-binding protein (CUT2 family) [Pelolinea submarina]BBB47236.1 methyl-galactoside transport system ATP-binding protein [Pelolinea submarina]
MSKTILETQHITKSFFGVKVLDDISFSLASGEVHALIGENGAGKSTLVKIIMGIYQRDEGRIFLDSEEVFFQAPRDALQHGISIIQQELAPIMDIDVAEYLYVGRELHKLELGPLSVVDQRRQRAEAKALFEGLDIDINPRSLMRDLSVAQMQLVEITKAISLSSKIIIMDEPTSAITYKEVETLFEQIRKLKKRGVGVIYISHKMEEIFTIADRITVLRDGKHIGTDLAENFTVDKAIKMMVGREIKEVYPKQKVAIGEPVLEVQHLSSKHQFHDINFCLRKGEILGIAGLVGAGRSELVECIFGITKADEGRVLVHGQAVQINHPKTAIRQRVALITEDRGHTGLNLKTSVEHNISLAHLERLARFGVIDRRTEAKAADSHINQLKIKALSRKSLVRSLSGGNQQKVVLAKWLLTEPDIIILDEPTRGIDVGSKRDIYLLMGELAKAGKAILMISSEIPELMGLSDRIIVLAAGRLTGELPQEKFTQEEIMTYASKFEVLHDEK